MPSSPWVSSRLPACISIWPIDPANCFGQSRAAKRVGRKTQIALSSSVDQGGAHLPPMLRRARRRNGAKRKLTQEELTKNQPDRINPFFSQLKHRVSRGLSSSHERGRRLYSIASIWAARLKSLNGSAIWLR